MLFLSRQVEGEFEIERWETADLGATWTHQAITAGSGAKNVRPFVPRNRQLGEIEVLWMQGRYDHWTEYETALRMWPAPMVPPRERPLM